MNHIYSKLAPVISIVSVMPLSALAQAESGGCSSSMSNLGAIINYILCILQSSIIPILVVAAIILFIYGVVKYIAGADNEKVRKEGSMFMIYGIISLFVITSIWGLVSILTNTFGIPIVIPQLPPEGN